MSVKIGKNSKGRDMKKKIRAERKITEEIETRILKLLNRELAITITEIEKK